MQGNPDFPPKPYPAQAASHSLCYSLGDSCPALHMHTMYIHTHKHVHSAALQETTALTVCGGGQGRWQGDSGLSWVGGKLLVKYTGMLYFNQPTTQHISRLPHSTPSPYTHHSAFVCAVCVLLCPPPIRAESPQGSPQWPFASSVPPSAHTAAALPQGTYRALCGEGPRDNMEA